MTGWNSLKVSPSELCLDFTLPTGQSFRWIPRSDDSYIGVIRDRVFHLRQTEDDVHYKRLSKASEGSTDDASLLRDYFNLETASLSNLTQTWSDADEVRFGKVSNYIKGARVLRQDPLECLFQFICSSNNHIGRIQGMVQNLCRLYGSPIHQEDFSEEDLDKTYQFPSLDQLRKANEADLRKHGFGYRAKYIEDCVKKLTEKPEGEGWLWSLRERSYEEASTELCTLPGVGPKVAACVCLFSLDKHQAIPVDTHVHQLALKYYKPDLKGKQLNKKLMKEIEDKLIEVFGQSAGWAHNVLFIAELASHQKYLPPELRVSKQKRKLQ